MNRKILPVLIASLALGASPVGLLSAAAQDATPILPKKGTTQGEQPQSGTSQQPSGAEAPSNGSGQEAPSAGTGDATTVKPDSGGTGTSGSSQGTDQPTTQQQDTTKPADGSTSQQAPASGSESEKSSTKSSGETTSPDGKATSDKPSDATGSGDTGTTGGSTTTGTSDQSTSTKTETEVNISVEQKTEIQQVVKEVNVEPVREVDFAVEVGTAIPKTIRLEPLPPRIVKIVPQYEGYRFFILADGRIIIVEPSTFKIVYIIV
ncbi:DUF1236 domain-containing protein [Rhizobium sp. SEMIA 4085]|uniref:DUF1236 domain-containing protein n=1 Tax=Rhizobium gallicum bv. gallicum R602sp TaxID=1041138 RepID=A0A0B4XH14_9HYPH|nr:MULTISPECIES: DUF1236 domain-containing protein [Rhizobium]AJD45732.1 hypothetical protein RGR602_PC01708 [Rhizobium gallicum bv. gallicum R602sp]NNH32102.1 DUF1236 domain-containing protein [Rhizobium sp. SEMIA 4085]TDW20933.1 uncharacterized protein DUF1236 [Rhizobium azibense]